MVARSSSDELDWPTVLFSTIFVFCIKFFDNNLLFYKLTFKELDLRLKIYIYLNKTLSLIERERVDLDLR